MTTQKSIGPLGGQDPRRNEKIQFLTRRWLAFKLGKSLITMFFFYSFRDTVSGELNLSVFADSSTDTKKGQKQSKGGILFQGHEVHGTCHVSNVPCNISPVVCCISPVTCH